MMKKLLVLTLILFKYSLAFALAVPESWDEIRDTNQFYGLAIDGNGNSYIATDGNKIIQVDKLGNNSNVLNTITVSGASKLASLAYLDGFLYAGDVRGSEKIYKINLSDFTNENFSGLSRFPDGLGSNGQLIYVAETDSSGRINGIDPETMTVVTELDSTVPDIVGITNQGEDLIVLSEFGDIYRVNSDTAHTQYLFSAPVKVTENAVSGPESILLINDILFIGYSTEKTIYIGNTGSSSNASYSLAVKKINLSALNVKGFGIFDVNLTQISDDFIFQVDDNVSVARNPNAISATFDLDTGVIEVPIIEFQDVSGTNLFSIELTLIPNTEPLQFKLTKATRIN